jgi:hypothetical protein
MALACLVSSSIGIVGSKSCSKSLNCLKVPCSGLTDFESSTKAVLSLTTSVADILLV